MESFDFNEPAGDYVLDLGILLTMLACEILFIANTRRKVDLKSVKYKPMGKKFKSVKLKRQDNDKSDFMTMPPAKLIDKKTVAVFEILKMACLVLRLLSVSTCRKNTT